VYLPIGSGAKLPYGIGEVDQGVYGTFGVWENSQPGYGGRYLGNIFDDIQKIAGKVGMVSGELSDVASGQKTVATIPTGYASLTIPVPGSPVSQAIPLWVLGVGAAGLLYLAFRKK
jgi:hypothetical protein